MMNIKQGLHYVRWKSLRKRAENFWRAKGLAGDLGADLAGDLGADFAGVGHGVLGLLDAFEPDRKEMSVCTEQ